MVGLKLFPSEPQVRIMYSYFVYYSQQKVPLALQILKSGESFSRRTIFYEHLYV